MTFRRLLLRNLFHYRGANIAAASGSALAAMMIVGSLLVGVSVRTSLRKFSEERLGRTVWAFDAGDRFFAADLAERVSKKGGRAACVLRLNGMARYPAGDRAAAGVNVIGIDSSFSAVSPGTEPPESGYLYINRRLADKLNVQKGASLVVRVNRPGRLPRDVPYLRPERPAVLRLRVGAVLSDRGIGRFGLRVRQVPPLNLFLNSEDLRRAVDQPDGANVYLAVPGGKVSGPRSAKRVLRESWRYTDGGLRLRPIGKTGRYRLQSRHVFIPRGVEDAVSGIEGAVTGFAYFVNRVSAGERTTPYSVAATPPAGSRTVRPSEEGVVLSRWLARDLRAAAGDTIKIAYYVFDRQRRLTERERELTVEGVVDNSRYPGERERLPDLPGVTDSRNCEDWDPGFSIDLSLIRPADERYWDRYGTLPKLYLNRKTARRMWGNPFGRVTEVALPAPRGRRALEGRLSRLLPPERFGLSLRNVRRTGQRAAEQSIDFSQLFLGLSFFIIAAGLALSAALYRMHLRRRADEVRLYTYLGLTRREVVRLFLTEGAVVCAVGTLAGTLLGWGFEHILLTALRTVWRDAVGTSIIYAAFSFPLLVGGAAVSFAAGMVFLVYAVRREWRFSRKDRRHRPRRYRFCIFPVSLVIMGGLLLLGVIQRGTVVSLLLAAVFLLTGITAFRYLPDFLRRLRTWGGRFSWRTLAAADFRYYRGLYTFLFGIVAAAAFIVTAVSSNQLDSGIHITKRSSGSGGFTHWVKTSVPLHRSPATVAGRSALKVDDPLLNGIDIMAMRRTRGDDASCLNLNRAQRPVLLGINTDQPAQRRSFRFSETMDGGNTREVWQALRRKDPDGVIPAVCDATVLRWGLSKRVGDILTFRDGGGKPFRVRIIAGLANSVFQGHILLDERFLLEKYPRHPGYNRFLLDLSGVEKPRETHDLLYRAFRDLGWDAETCRQRLDRFNTVNNTYLVIFQSFGVLGLLVGMVGITVLLWRHFYDRLGELAVMQTIGVTRERIWREFFKRTVSVIAVAVMLGLYAGFLAVWHLLARSDRVPWGSLTLQMALIVLTAAILLVVLLGRILRRPVVDNLRLE